MKNLEPEERKKIVGEGSEDDIYCWVTSIPDKILPPVADGACRAETLFNMERYGYCKNLPADRRREKGVYFRTLGYVDFKVPWLIVRIGRPFVYGAMRDFVL